MATRILALDYGTKRMGVALSDELGWTAQPLETYERRTLELDLAHIQQLVNAHEVREVLIGLPLRLNGEEGPAVQAVHCFVDRLGEVLSVPIVLWDERMTTRSAEELLIAADVSRKKRKGVVDRVAAAILLQGYLEAQAASPSPGTEHPSAQQVEEEWGESSSTDQSHDASWDPHHRRHSRRARRGGRLSNDSMG
ncbi:MAG: Holliday junction resolvase RuvX [Nitrospira sp.]|nr:Holliday junction resolvase RuvX [Nitrospira sp.]MBS0155880.1 Holliday junction resolvase RuvX [Nitrospira sp.]MBS0166760.1 Holliday junction resolvase RuvX [Nitrospira sp.]